MNLDQLKDTAIGIIFRIYLVWFRKLGPRSRPFLIYQPLAINQKPIKIGL